MCNPLKAIARATGLSGLFDGGGPDPAIAALTDTLRQQNQIASDSAAAALQAQKDAQARAEAAARPAVDSEASRLAGEAKLRKLIAANAPIVNAGKTALGAPPVGYRMLTGN